jgi:hypothetical protein
MFVFKNIQNYNESLLRENIVIALINPLLTPVHIALISKGECFELTVKGVKQTNALALTKANVPKLFILINAKDIKVSPKEIFSAFFKADKNISCLLPIASFLAQNVNSEFADCKIIFDVLEKLLQKQMSYQIYHQNLEEEINNNIFHLPLYTAKEVNNYIQKLKTKLAKQDA